MNDQTSANRRVNPVRALLSVSDKTGIVAFAQGLHAAGVELLSTGGTASLLAKEGIPVTEVSSYTGFPEMMDGRVKTLHPKVHGGILGRRGTDDRVMSEHGIDQIEFLVSTNYGMPLKSLNKTASGGELSRISLAIQVITSEKSDTPTLVFDEVDVGVGGKVAQIVGARLRNLGRYAQVICITHQAQVAAQGQQHLLIDKVSNQDETFSTILALNEELRIAEIARMLGGEVITDRTRAHAQEMLDASLIESNA